MSDEAVVSMANEISAADVAAYLEAHPDFFHSHSGLLTLLSVPHPSGTAVSLVERQTSLLRERNQKLNERMSEWMEAAHYNEQQFEKTRRMVLNLLESMTLDDLSVAVEDSLCDEFHNDATVLMLFSEKQYDTNSISIIDPRQYGPLTPLVVSNLPTCGQLTEEQNSFIFGDKAVRVQSAAVVPLVKGETIGLLAVGSYKADHFQSSQGTVFLSYVGEVLSRVLSRILHQGN